MCLVLVLAELVMMPNFMFSSPLVHLLFICLFHVVYQVKIQTWVDDENENEFVGVGARFGVTLEAKEKHANRTHLSLLDPSDGCTMPAKKVIDISCFHPFDFLI